MRIQDIIRFAQEYLLLGIVLALMFVTAILAGYFVIYKKVLKGSKTLKLNRKKTAWWCVFICYMAVVFGATLLSRGSFYSGKSIVSVFYTYKEAWISGSESTWRNMILNVLMFVPLGFWLPVGFERFRIFWKTYGVGLGLTIFIELIQLLLGKGIVEMADVCHNLAGAMIGYGCYKLLMQVILIVRKNHEKWLPVLVAQLPLMIIICLFTGINIAYEKQELGNISYEYIEAYDTDKILSVTTTSNYRQEEKTVPVYTVRVLSLDETKQLAEELFALLGSKLDESRTDVYENTVFYWDDSRHNITIDFKGGTYSITDYETIFGMDDVEYEIVEIATEEEIRVALEQYGIEVFEQAEFINMGNGVYQFAVNQLIDDNTISDGIISCKYYNNGKCGSITNSVIEAVVYKEFEIISEKDAYELITEGKFVYNANENIEIILGEVWMDYIVDSKGFYQPVYFFDAVINQEETLIGIPAIR